MSSLCSSSPAQTLASQRARSHFLANQAALSQTDSRLAFPHDAEFVFARDGSLTVLESGHAFRGQCSVPTAAARAMLEGVRLARPVAVMLAPVHAAQVRVLLDQIPQGHALVVIIPEEQDAGVILSCGDFSGDIENGRCFFLTGQAWDGEFLSLIDQHPGLPVPTQLVRLHDSLHADQISPRVHELVQQCERGRQAQIKTTRQNPDYRYDLGIALPSDGPWNSPTLTQVNGLNDTISTLDVGDVRHTGPLGLAQLASRCRSVLVAEITRKQAGEIAPQSTRWLTWSTGDHVPPAEGALAHDRIILADPQQQSAATQSGWTARQISVAREYIGSSSADASPLSAVLIPFVDPSADVPAYIQDRSSVQLLWERLEHELCANPFVGRGAARPYVEFIARDMGVQLDGLSMEWIAHGLIPRCLAAAVRIACEKRGVTVIPGLRLRSEFDAQVVRASAVVDLWPVSASHAIRRVGRPVLRAWCGDERSLFRPFKPAVVAPSMGVDFIAKLVRSHE